MDGATLRNNTLTLLPVERANGIIHGYMVLRRDVIFFKYDQALKRFSTQTIDIGREDWLENISIYTIILELIVRLLLLPSIFFFYKAHDKLNRREKQNKCDLAYYPINV